MEEPRVSDHAVLRYLQRRYGMDIEGIRSHISTLRAEGARRKALAVKVEGVRFVIIENTVVTVITRRMTLRLPRNSSEVNTER